MHRRSAAPANADTGRARGIRSDPEVGNSDKAPKKGAAINIISSIDRQVVGGMTYFIDPSLEKRLPELPTLEGKCVRIAQDLLDCDQKVKSVQVNASSVQINF